MAQARAPALPVSIPATHDLKHTSMVGPKVMKVRFTKRLAGIAIFGLLTLAPGGAAAGPVTATSRVGPPCSPADSLGFCCPTAAPTECGVHSGSQWLIKGCCPAEYHYAAMEEGLMGYKPTVCFQSADAARNYCSKDSANPRYCKVTTCGQQ